MFARELCEFLNDVRAMASGTGKRIRTRNNSLRVLRKSGHLSGGASAVFDYEQTALYRALIALFLTFSHIRHLI
jgi:hypothetical protein